MIFQQVLDSLDIENQPYVAGNALNAAGANLQAAGFLELAVEKALECQNKETGLWGKEVNYDATNAAMKISSLFSRAKVQYPYLDKMIESTLYLLQHGGKPEAVVDIYNPFQAMFNAMNTYESVPQNLLDEIYNSLPQINECLYNNMLLFKKEDGGFSYLVGGSSPTSQGVTVSYGTAEGDVNATVLACAARNLAYMLAGCAKARPACDIYIPEFVDLIENAKPIVKKPIDKSMLTENFDSSKVGEDPVSFTLSKQGARLEAVLDPMKIKGTNKCLMIGTNKGVQSYAQWRNINSGTRFKESTVSFDFMILSNEEDASAFNITIGNTLAQLVLTKKGEKVQVSSRTGWNGLGDVFATVDTDAWVNIKVKFIPEDKDGKIRFFVDDEEAFKTNQHWNNNDASVVCPAVIDKLEFRAFTDSTISLYVDNLNIDSVKGENQ